MTTTHTLHYPSFDPAWAWSGAALLLTTGEHLILMKRSFDMPTHKGQMAFFAGHRKPDEEHAVAVAKREFEEESGLPSDCWELEGVLNPVFTARGQAIVPVVGRLKMELGEFFSKVRSNGEWTDLIAVPWTALQDEKNWEWPRGTELGPAEVRCSSILWPRETTCITLETRQNHSCFGGPPPAWFGATWPFTIGPVDSLITAN